MNILMASLRVLAIAGVGGALFVYTGIYNIGADAPHLRPVYWLLETFRDRSIAAHARDVAPPAPATPAMIAAGAEHYAEMCSGCHLAPGIDDSEIRVGLYPEPPNLTTTPLADPARAFWVIKHGVKMTAMPAWGRTHDDDIIWSLVAFVGQLPQLSAPEYAQLTGHGSGHDHHHDPGAGRDEHEHGEHDHSGHAGGDELPD